MVLSDNDPDAKQQIFTAFFIGVLALLPLLAVSIPRFLGIGPSLAALSFALAGFFIWRDKTASPKEILPKEAFIWAGALLALAGVSSLWAEDTGFALERTGKIAAILLPGLMLAPLVRLMPQKAIEKSALIFPAALAVAVLAVLVEFAADFPLYRLVRGLGREEFLSPVILNRSLVICVVCFFPAFAIAYGRLTRRSTPELFAISMILCAGLCVALIYTQSQTAQLAFLGGAAVYLAYPYCSRYLWRGAALMTALCALTAPWAATYLYETFAAGLEHIPLTYEASVPHRLEIWSQVSAIILQHPLLGNGIEATRFLEFDKTGIYTKANTILHPHNAALQLWVEFGVIGMLLGAGFFIRLLLKATPIPQAAPDGGGPLRLSRPNRLFVTNLFVCLSVALTGYGLWQSWLLGLFLLSGALAILSDRVVESESGLKSKPKPKSKPKSKSQSKSKPKPKS